MSTFNYMFYETTELIIAEIKSDVALPGIDVGNELILSTESYGKTGGLLHIEHVRVATSYWNGAFQRYDIHVICRFGDSKAGF
ncbi:hypothetical protein ASF70_15865 [Rhizobium sp. Leaf321]|uniref:hypothetical protein n=1 Tax=Rhizobium sp. Leaf321 TaxID=1736335 RepID=UPI000715EEA6|nr:hypothetical protein [Rhizobium sp. Leaf321]KQQ72945.1 hypothetical protein ASF70_15865 [Rhizobium sp. Leaf321]